MTQQEYIALHISTQKAYIRELFRSIGNSNSLFFVKCMYHCIQEQKAELRKYIDVKK